MLFVLCMCAISELSEVCTPKLFTCMFLHCESKSTCMDSHSRVYLSSAYWSGFFPVAGNVEREGRGTFLKVGERTSKNYL